MAPADLPRSVIDGLQSALSPEIPAVASVSFGLFTGVRQIHQTVALHCIYIKQPGFRVEAGREPVRSAARIRIEERAIRLRLLLGIRDRLAFFVDSLCPVSSHEWSTYEILAIRSV